ncbi:uncharacterized protein [Cicer arietinum]|uniref:uncharacterized protein n=1 Tax=Cicer arietinum TaxID=3827 RepID=UPI003CC6212B
MNGGGFPSNFPIIDGKNWKRWSVSMRSLLGVQEVFEIVQDGYEQLVANPIERQQTTFKDCKKRNCKALFYIQQMEEDEAVADYFNRVQVVVNQMRTIGESLTEVVIIEKILRTLTQRYDHIVVAIEESKDLDKMKVEDLQGSLEAYELRVRERSKKVQREDDESQMAAEDSDSNEVLLMATTKSDDDCPEQWYLDTDNSSVTAEGIGKVLIQRRNGKQSFICDVLHVPNTKNNLLSLGQLLEKGYSMKMEQGEMRLFDDPKRLILKAPLSKNRTFKIDIQINESNCLAAEVMNEDWLWLGVGIGQRMVQGILKIKMPKELCEECCQLKQHRNSFKAEVSTRSSRMMKTIYSDVCGPFEEVSIRGNHYFVRFYKENLSISNQEKE